MKGFLLFSNSTPGEGPPHWCQLTSHLSFILSCSPSPHISLGVSLGTAWEKRIQNSNNETPLQSNTETRQHGHRVTAPEKGYCILGLGTYSETRHYMLGFLTEATWVHYLGLWHHIDSDSILSLPLTSWCLWEKYLNSQSFYLLFCKMPSIDTFIAAFSFFFFNFLNLLLVVFLAMLRGSRNLSSLSRDRTGVLGSETVES